MPLTSSSGEKRISSEHHLQIYKPDGFKVPFVPGVCGFCIFGGIFLMGNAGGAALWRFGIVIGVCIVSLPLQNAAPSWNELPQKSFCAL